MLLLQPVDSIELFQLHSGFVWKHLEIFDLDGVAVGAQIALHPPHRSQRAELPHWAPALGSDVQAEDRQWMEHFRRRNPVPHKACHPGPVQSVALAPAAKRLEPQADKAMPEGCELPAV
jgi:hypothetical protein